MPRVRVYDTNEKGMWGAMNDVDDSDHELTDEQRDKLRKAIGEIIGDFKRVHRHHIGSDSDTLRAHAIRRVRMHFRP